MRRVSGERWFTLVVVAGILLSGLLISARTSPPVIAAGPGLSISGSVTGGGNMTIRVTLARTNLTAITVKLNSSRPSIVPVPATMTIPRGAGTASIQVRTVAINVDRTVNITGSWLSERQTKSILVKAPRLENLVPTEPIIAGDYFRVRVSISAPAPSSGLYVTFDPSGDYLHDETVRIAPGKTSASTSMRAANILPASKQTTLTARLNGRSLTIGITIYRSDQFTATPITPTQTPGVSPTSFNGSVTPTRTPTPFNGSVTPTRTPTPFNGSVTPTRTPTLVITPSLTPSRTSTPFNGSVTPTRTPTLVNTPTLTPTRTPSSTATPTRTATPVTPTATFTATTTATPSIASVSIDCPSYIFVGNSATCQAGLSFWVYGNLPPQTIQLSTANGYVLFPSAQVVLPPPAFIATFTITGGSSGGLETITASVDTVSTQAAVQVANNAATIDCPTYTFTVGNEVQCGLILSEPAPVDLVFTRYQASSDVNIPDTIVIPAGSTAFYFIARRQVTRLVPTTCTTPEMDIEPTPFRSVPNRHQHQGPDRRLELGNPCRSVCAFATDGACFCLTVGNSGID